MTNTLKRLHIMLGISGGVDSAVAAYLLKKQGHDVEGVFMKNWEGDDTDSYCAAAKDKEDAETICAQLKIPFHMVNFADDYWQKVFTHFLAEYQAGRTPNPDILCNKEIKFAAFLDYAKQKGADKIATGHYARTAYHADQVHLLKGTDPLKDQSYFLHALNQTQLMASIFPIGHLAKTTVRAMAMELRFINHAKKDSTGICFIGERKFKHFLNEYLPAKPGLIRTLEGEVVGKHTGLMFYTIGQRQGLEIGGLKDKQALPWYVAKKDLRHNELIVVQGEHPALYQHMLTVDHIHWINSPPPLPSELWAKTRYRQTDQLCQVAKNPSKAGYQVTFSEAQRAITPGQSIVFYQHDVCLGGGIIT